jgi:glycine oxidase
MADRLLIVGGGIVGLGIGWQMAKAGQDVVLFEARKPGRGASWAAAGILSAHLQSDDPRDPLERFQRHSQQLWPDFAAELEGATGLDLGLRREGVVALALTEEEARTGRQLAQGSGAMQHGFRWLDSETLRATEPYLAPDALGAVLSRFDQQVDNRTVVKALRLAFEEAGGELRTGTAVRDVLVDHGVARGVETDTGVELGSAVVLAAGAWSRRIGGLPGAALPIAPIAGQMLAVVTDPAAPILQHVVMTSGGYLVPRKDGRLLVGATSEPRGFDGRHTANGLLTLAALLRRTLPVAGELPIEESWVGFRPGAPDHLPLLGPYGASNLVVATGHGHNGILMAPATIEAVCVYLLTGEADPAFQAFTPLRFERE